MIELESVKKFFEENFYVSNEKLNYYTLLGINLIKEARIREGQDIYAVLLDGPPGAGKSLYSKLYAKMVHELLNKEVALISYQCDDATSKIELFEDINVGAAVAGKSEEVNIPGVLARAILSANEGKKVILFIDEYDKSREQVDSLFLQFLQDGRINTNQFGDLQIKDEYKGNIQVIFCKNDFRTELTGPLMRRLRKIQLTIIKPQDFYDLAVRKFVKNDNSEIVMPIIDLVSSVYESVYEKEDYTRLPATSEMFGAIEDIMFLNKVNAPGSIVYNVLVEDLFKNEDDRELFNSSLNNLDNDTLQDILFSLKKDKNEDDVILSINEKITKAFKEAASKDLDKEREELRTLKTDLETQKTKLENEYAKKEKALNEKEKTYKEDLDIEYANKEKKLYEELKKIEEFASAKKKEFEELIAKKKTKIEKSTATIGELYAKNFEDASTFIKRNQNVFLDGFNWKECATLVIPKKDFDNNKLIEEMLKSGYTIYANGFCKKFSIELKPKEKETDVLYILVREKNETDNLTFHIFNDYGYDDSNSYLAHNINTSLKEPIAEIISKIVYLNNYPLYHVYANGKEIFLFVSSDKIEKENQKVLSLIKG